MQNNCHLARLVHEQAQTYGRKTALSYRDYDTNRWRAVSWERFADTVRQTSRALLAAGIGRQEVVAVLAQNMPECLYTAFGAYGLRAVVTPFYATSSAAQISYMMNDAGARLLFVGEQQQYDTAFSVVAVCQKLERIIIFDRKVVKKPGDTLSLYFDEFLKTGDAEGDAEISARTAEASEADLADILYTSGTTGKSKGVMITHGMYREAFRVNDACLPLSERDVILNFLPFTHIFERAWSYLGLTEGAQLAINLRPQDVLRSLQEVHPTCMASVPRFWEKVYHAVLEKCASGPALQRKLIREALVTGEKRWTEYIAKGKTPPIGLELKYKLYDRTVIRTLRKTLGLEHANFFPTAGAAVAPEVEKFVHAAGITMLTGYGMTETTATVSCDHWNKPITPGSVGRLIEGIEIKFSPEGEILLRGKTITPGYYKKESTTKESFDEEGFLRTGDAGYMKNGELYLTERIKDLFKTSNGKYIAPQMIETKLALDPHIEQIVAIADQRKFCSALIVPDYKLIENFARTEGIAFSSREELCAHPAVVRMMAARIDALQQELAHYEKVKRFVLLPAPLTIENGELTNTLKIRRRVVCERYAALIDKMYLDAEQGK